MIPPAGKVADVVHRPGVFLDKRPLLSLAVQDSAYFLDERQINLEWLVSLIKIALGKIVL